MMKILKYELIRNGEVQAFPFGVGAEVVRFALQHGSLHIWVLFSDQPEQDTKMRTFQIFGTGCPIPDGALYVASCEDSPFIWHLFELV